MAYNESIRRNGGIGMKEMKKTAGTLDRVFKVLKIMLDIGLIASLVALAILAAGLIFNLDAEQIGTFSRSIELGFAELRFAEAYMPDQKAILLSAGAQVLMTLSCLWAARIAVGCVREILAPMTQGEPFGGIVSAKLKKLSVLSLLLGVIVEGIRMIEQSVTTGIMDIGNLLLSEKIAGVSFQYEMDLTFLLVFAALRLLSYVFRYGEELQRQSDETL